MTFQELGIEPNLLRAVQELGFTEPMPVQAAVIPRLLGAAGDLIALAQTGTGKTAAYGLPLLQLLRPGASADSARGEFKGGKGVAHPQALVLTPTRELCLQVAGDLQAYGRYLEAADPVAVYGGASVEAQQTALRRNPPVVVATPGRLLDLLRRGVLSLGEIVTVVLDEADIMLDMGFLEDIEEILRQAPEREHLLLFSATMGAEVRKVIAEMLHEPEEIQIGAPNVANANIVHRYCTVPAAYRYQALKRIADYYPEIYGIIFCRTRTETKELADRLIQDGYNADALHGDLSQAQRELVMLRFRQRALRLLVATDVAARGLDVNNVTHVIHYGLPDDVENYTHRSGRTARAGKRGISVAICHLREKARLRQIEKSVGAKFEAMPLPTGQEICGRQLAVLADRLLESTPSAETQEALGEVLPMIVDKLEPLPKEELIRRLMATEFERFFSYYRNAPEIPTDSAELKGKERRKERRASASSAGGAEEGMTRLFINLGKKDKLFPNKLIDLINRNTYGHPEIGRIDLMSTFSFFDIADDAAAQVVEALQGLPYGTRTIIIDYADKASGNGGESGVKKRKKKRAEEYSEEAPKRKKSDRAWEQAERELPQKEGKLGRKEARTKPAVRKPARKEDAPAYNYPKAHGSKFIPAPGSGKKKKKKK